MHHIRKLDKSLPLGPGNFRWEEQIGIAEEAKAYARAWHQANKRTTKGQNLKRAYGITIDDYEKMEAEQGHVCAICGKTERAVDRHSQLPRRLAVDHDHTTGKIRGLLCGDCNKGLGHFYDNPDLLELAIGYLRKHTR